jgi:hypothetical protein
MVFGVFVGSKVLVPFMISLSTSRALHRLPRALHRYSGHPSADQRAGRRRRPVDLDRLLRKVDHGFSPLLLRYPHHRLTVLRSSVQPERPSASEEFKILRKLRSDVVKRGDGFLAALWTFLPKKGRKVL